MIARIINTPQFCLITLSKEDGSEIVSSWSDIYTLIEKVKGIAKVPDIPFYEVYPIKNELINNANERHFWHGQDISYFDLSKLENAASYSFQEYVI